MQRQIENFSLIQITGPLVIASAGLVILGIQPVLFGPLIDTGHVTLDQVGLLALAEIVCVGLGAGIAPAVFPLNRFRMVTALACLIAAAANLFSSRTAGFGDLLAARAAAGAGVGVLVWVATCVIVRFHTPDRLAGFFLTGQTLLQAAVAAALALFVIPSQSWQGGFDTLGVLILLAGAQIILIPSSMCALTEEESVRPPLTIPVLLASLVIMSQMAVVGSLWTFIDPIAQAAGIEQQTIQLVISGTLIMQAIGAAVAAGVAPRLSAPVTLAAGGLVQASIAALFAGYLTDSLSVFVAVCAIFGFFWMFLMPFHVQLALRVDPSGRLAVFGAGLQLLGTALGPLAASVLVTEKDASPAATVSMVFALISAAAVGLLHLLHPSTSPEAHVADHTAK